MRVDIWSDLVCPWCYLGKRRFETALAVFPRGNEVEVVHRSFQLDPSIPKGVSLRSRDMLMRKYRMSEQGIQDAVIERLFRAHFTENTSLFDHHSLVTLGGEAGLSGVEQLLENDRYEDAVVADQRVANELGVNGVPFFILDGRYGVSGAQSVEAFGDALARC